MQANQSMLLRGTLILTIAGLITRILGFAYKLILTRFLTAYELGLYQMVLPISGILYAVCTAGYQTAISRYTSKAPSRANSTLTSALLLTIPLSIILSLAVFINSEPIAANILLNIDSASAVRMLSLSFTFSTFHNCVCGYYYGKSKTSVPSISLFIEQLIRIFTLLFTGIICRQMNIDFNAAAAIISNICGEFAACLYIYIKSTEALRLNIDIKQLKNILAFGFPLSMSSLLMHILTLGEAVLIPAQLTVYGIPKAEAIRLYGILTGMVMPFIMFPSSITNSLSLLLVPKVAADESTGSIDDTIKLSLQLSCGLGVLSVFMYLCLGANIAGVIFNEKLCVSLVQLLAWLCPFIYLSTTLTSILDGLGAVGTTCFLNILSIFLRLVFLILFVPEYGLNAYLYSLLITRIALCLGLLIALKRLHH